MRFEPLGKVLWLLVASSFGAGCPTPTRPEIDAGRGSDVGESLDVGSACTVGMGGVRCVSGVAVLCNADGTEASRESCGMAGQACFDGFGCGICDPGSARCEGDVLSRCAPDGSGYAAEETCDATAGQTCSATRGACVSACVAAIAEDSYLGCEYFATPVTNAELRREVFTFAVAVANPNAVDVTVEVTRGSSDVTSTTVPAGGLSTIELPWVEELQAGATASVMVPDGAYRLVASLPVTVYQFNPLEYVSNAGGFEQFSFTNDASLLLPAHALTGNYLVMSRPTHIVDEVFHHPSGDSMSEIRSPGFVAVTCVSSSAMVELRFTARTLAAVGTSAIRAYAPGDTATFTMGQGDVLQILSAGPETCARTGEVETQDFGGGVTQDHFYCNVGREYDLTGTQIRATGVVSVLSGHNCAFVPSNRWACDHLEEQMFPVETWGRDAIVSITMPLRGEPNVVRILSGHDANTITFDPPSVHEPITLGLGEFIEFEASAHFRAQGTQPFAIAQFMVGQDYAGIATSGMMASGDPSYSLAIPTQQFRTSYTFLAPTTYASNMVNITAPMGASVTLDGTTVPSADFTAVGATGMGVARVMIEGGTHRIEAPEAFGIVVYGYGRYTSYMVPGGLDLEAISAPF